jgi:hypothetical protein
MSREVCGICWTPYDDSYKCACPTPALDAMKCPRCGKVTRPDDVHTCTPKALRLADALSSNGEGCECHASSYYECGCDDAIWPEMYVLQAAAELRRLHAMTERRLTDEVIADLWYKNGTYHHHFARAIERYLKGEQ